MLFSHEKRNVKIALNLGYYLHRTSPWLQDKSRRK